MSPGWAGPVWGEPSAATQAPVPLRASAKASDASYRADGGRSSEFVVLAASVSGVAHRLSGRRGEDSYAWAQPGPGRLAVVIADGVSAAGRGGEGAEVAVGAACHYLLRSGRPWGDLECVAALQAASEELARAGGDAAAELSTTLVVVLVTGRAGGADVALARVGDSTAFVLTEGAWSEVSSGPGEGDCEEPEQPGGVRSTSTNALPLPRGGAATVETASAALPYGAAIVLMTDGLANPLRDGPASVAPALAELLRAGPGGGLSPLDLARAADFSRRGAHDDRTILVAWPISPPAPA